MGRSLVFRGFPQAGIGLFLALGVGLVACGRSTPAPELTALPLSAGAELASIDTSPTVTASPTDLGYDYQAPNDSFRIRFPAPPETRTSPWVAAHYDGGTRFYYARGDAPDSAIDAADRAQMDDYFQVVAKGVARQFGATTFMRSERARSASVPTLKFSFRNKRGIRYDARAIFRPEYGQLFVLVFGTTEDESPAATREAQAFFQSFRPLDGAESAP